MTRLKREDVIRYSCNYCQFYCSKWACALEECFLKVESKERNPVEWIGDVQARWEVIG